MSSTTQAYSTLVSYSTNRKTLTTSLISKRKELRQAKAALQLLCASSVSIDQVSAQQNIVDALETDISNALATLNQLMANKTTAQNVILSNSPVSVLTTPPLTANLFDGGRGPTGPQGPTVGNTIAPTIVNGSTSAASSGSVYSVLQAFTQSAPSSVNTGTSSGGDPNVLLLCHFNSSGTTVDIVDSSYYRYPQRNIIVAYPAALSTSTKKFDNASLLVNSGYVSISSPIQIGSQSFTWETWVNFTVIFSVQYLYSLGNNSTGFCVAINGSTLYVYLVGNTYSWTQTFATGTWYHIAVVVNNKSNGSVTPYINGTPLTSTSISTVKNVQSGSSIIGNYTNYTLTAYAYLDEMCLRLGTTYTASFTPPTTAYADAFPTCNFPSNPTNAQVWTDGRDLYMYTTATSTWLRMASE